MTTTLTPVYRRGDHVTYLGNAAKIVLGNEASDWTFGVPAATVNILLDAPVRGMSRQMDVPASAVLPAAKAARQ